MSTHLNEEPTISVPALPGMSICTQQILVRTYICSWKVFIFFILFPNLFLNLSGLILLKINDFLMFWPSTFSKELLWYYTELYSNIAPVPLIRTVKTRIWRSHHPVVFKKVFLNLCTTNMKYSVCIYKNRNNVLYSYIQ